MKIGFIGSGVMANAMIGGIIKSGLYQADDIIGAAPTECGRNRTKEQNGIEVTADNLEVIDKCDVVFLSVKPQHYAPVIAEIKEHVKADQLFISIGAGITLDYLKKAFDDKAVDRKSTRLNSSHGSISYAVFCLKKKNNRQRTNCVYKG